VVVREHKINGVSCKDYSNTKSNLTLTLTLTPTLTHVPGVDKRIYMDYGSGDH